MKFTYFNDTKRVVTIHPATISHGCIVETKPIQPLEERVFILPDHTIPWVKMWDYGQERGLSILVSPRVEEESHQENVEWEKKRNRAYELLQEMYDNDFVIPTHLKAEIGEILK